MPRTIKNLLLVGACVATSFGAGPQAFAAITLDQVAKNCSWSDGKAKIVIKAVACDTVTFIALSKDKKHVAVTVAIEAAPKTVDAGHGSFQMVYPLQHRLFEVDLPAALVHELTLPQVDFPDDPSARLAMGYDPRGRLIIVARGSVKQKELDAVQRVVQGGRGWRVGNRVTFTPDAMPDARVLCGDNYTIKAAYVRTGLQHPCVQFP